MKLIKDRGVDFYTERTKLKPALALMAISASLLLGSQVHARGEVETIYTQETRGSLRGYTVDDTTYEWGAGRNLLITGFQYEGREYDYRQASNRVLIRRVDNPNASGNRCSVFVENTGNSLSYAPSYPDDGSGTGSCDLARIISGRTLNSGALDLFANAGDNERTFKNIERVDFISDAGIISGSTAEALTDSGHVVIEKSGNNEIKMAAILALDESGDPASYGPMVLVNSNRYGDESVIRYGVTDLRLDLDFLANEDSDNPGYMTYIEAISENLGMAFISKQDLGISLNQTYYGFSLFAPDVDPNIHDLLDPSSFPLDTIADNLGPGDADVFAGSAFPTDPVNAAPVAVDDETATALNTAVSIPVTSNDIDPDGNQLIVALGRTPDNGTLSLDSNNVIYTPNQGFQGFDSFTYTVDDGNGATDTATVRVAVTNDNQPPVAQDDEYSVSSGTSKLLDILSNDNDPEGGSLAVTILSNPGNGSLSINGDQITYQPNDGFSGSDQFTYRVEDEEGSSDTATVRISVGGVLGETAGRIETGLEGHGAGSIGGIWLLLLGLASAARLRRED